MNSRLILIPSFVFLLVLPFPHTIALRLLALFGVLVTAVIMRNRLDVPALPHKGVIFLWASLAFLSLLWAVDAPYSLNEIKVEIGYAMLAYFGFFVLADSEAFVKKLLWALLLASLGVCIMAVVRAYPLYDFLEDIRRYTLGVGNTSTYIVTVLPMLGLLAYLLFSQMTHRAKRYAVVLVSFVVLSALLSALLITQNRMVWLVLATQLVVLFALLKSIRPMIKLGLFVMIFVTFFSAYVYVSIEKSQMQQFSTESLASSFAEDERIELWTRVMPILAAKPWTGEGFGRRALAKSHAEFSGHISKWHAHNLFLDYAAQMGIGGVVVLALLFGAITQRFALYLGSTGQLHVIGLTGILIVAGVLAKNMTDDFFNRDLALLFWAQIGILLGWGERLLRKKESDVMPFTSPETQ